MKKSEFWGAISLFVIYLLSLITIVASIIGICICTNNELLVQSILSLLLGLSAHITIVTLICFITGE